MKRFFSIVILLCLFTHVSQAQELWKKRRYEAIGSIGTTQFFGDIGGYTKTKDILGLKDISFKQTRFNLSAGLRYRIFKNVNARLSLTYGMFRATDKRGSNEGRGLEARTSMFEPVLIAEYDFIKTNRENSYLFNKHVEIQSGGILPYLDFYAFTGIGGLSYKVKGNDKLVAFGMKNSGFTAVIPLGVGFKMLAGPNYDLGFELGGRYTFSDYLDGYTSQYSSSNDVYYFFNVTFIYKILTGDNGLPAFLNKSKF